MVKSDFGKGLCYNLGLFLAHAERFEHYLDSEKRIENEMKKEFPKFNTEEHASEMWFNGAGDHFFDLEIPKTLPKSLQKRLKKFQNKVLKWRCVIDGNYPNKKDVEWALHEAKDLLRLMDKFHGIKTIKARWE